MPDYECPDCGGGFPAPADACPWCGCEMDAAPATPAAGDIQGPTAWTDPGPLDGIRERLAPVDTTPTEGDE